MFITSPTYHYQFDLTFPQVAARAPSGAPAFLAFGTDNKTLLIRNDGEDALLRFGPPGTPIGYDLGGVFRIPAGASMVLEQADLVSGSLGYIGGPLLICTGGFVSCTTPAATHP